MNEAAAAPHSLGPQSLAQANARWRWPENAAIFILALALSVYLALTGGGYDIVARSEIGLVVWWFLLLGILIGALPRAQVPRAAWIAVALLAGFLVWTWIGLSWTTSHERTLAQVCRLSTYLGVLLIGLCVVREHNVRALIAGLACGIAVVSFVAVLSKLTPSLFPANTAASFYATARLSYPFDYADGVGEYAALGIPLVLLMATGARSLLVRALGAAMLLPVLLCLAMTVSRGGILAAAVGGIAFLALVPDRIPRLPSFAVSGAGIGVLMLALLHRPALRDSLAVAPAAQRHSMLIILCAVMAGVAAAQVILQLAMRHFARPRWLQVSRRGAQRVSAAILVAVLAVVAVGVGGGTAGRLWSQFKQWQPAKSTNQYNRLLSVAGSHRYQYWQVAWRAFTSSPLHGIGPGTYRYYWEAHTTPAHAEFILNAHSLWFETLAETGIVGWALLAGFFAAVVWFGIVRSLRSAGAAERAVIATCTAAVLAFMAAASFDWIWQIGVVPMVMMLLAAGTFTASPEAAVKPAASGPRAWWAISRRLIFAAGALLAMALIAVPLISTIEVRASQAAARTGRLKRALADANVAASVEPGAASPYLQRALVFEQAGDTNAAAREIMAAIAREPVNYVLWLTAERIQTELDHPRQALADYRRARTLYPTSTVFGG